MGISITANNKITLLTFIFTIIKKRRKKHQYYCYKTKWDINNRSCLMNSLHVLQGQFLGTQLSIRALNSSRDLEFFISVGTLSNSFKLMEDAIPFSTWYTTAKFRLIPQIIRYISKFKNTCHQFWNYSTFNFEYFSH